MKTTLADLERVAESLAIKISYDDIKTSRGGSCRVMESRRIIINKHLPAGEKIALLARELSGFDLTGVDVPDRVKKKILHESEHRRVT